jgi:hypothetical protein
MPKAEARGGRRLGLVRRQRVPWGDRGRIERREGFKRGIGIVRERQTQRDESRKTKISKIVNFDRWL